MGLFWDLLQQSQISKQQAQSVTLEQRVQRLESELARSQRLLHHLIQLLEQRFGEDINGDGKVG